MNFREFIKIMAGASIIPVLIGLTLVGLKTGINEVLTTIIWGAGLLLGVYLLFIVVRQLDGLITNGKYRTLRFSLGLILLLLVFVLSQYLGAKLLPARISESVGYVSLCVLFSLGFSAFLYSKIAVKVGLCTKKSHIYDAKQKQ